MVTTLKLSEEIQKNINKCLSSSGVCGNDLRQAHYYLGSKLAEYISQEKDLNNKKIAVVIMMRAGLPFGLGLADSFDKANQVNIFFSPINDETFCDYDYVVIADAVINTGRTIFETVTNINKNKIIIATNVISEKYISNFDELNTFAVRISLNSYKGSNVKTISNGKGPDTGDRLFSNAFYK